MNRIAFIFTQGPHGNAAGREGLDALLATSAYTKDVGVFFISDGVLLLLPQQQPAKILARDFVASFGILSIYDIKRFYLCADSAAERGLQNSFDWVLDTKLLSAENLGQHLSNYNTILTF